MLFRRIPTNSAALPPFIKQHGQAIFQQPERSAKGSERMPGRVTFIMAAAGGQHADRFGHAKRLGHFRIERRFARTGHRGDKIHPKIGSSFIGFRPSFLINKSGLLCGVFPKGK